MQWLDLQFMRKSKSVKVIIQQKENSLRPGVLGALQKADNSGENTMQDMGAYAPEFQIISKIVFQSFTKIEITNALTYCLDTCLCKNLRKKYNSTGLHKNDKIERCNCLYRQNLVYCTSLGHFIFFHTNYIILYFSSKLDKHIHAYIL